MFSIVTLRSPLWQKERRGEESILTPANQNVDPEVFPLREERDGQQGMKIKSLHQQPEETGHYTVLEENNHGLAANLAKVIKQ